MNEMLRTAFHTLQGVLNLLCNETQAAIEDIATVAAEGRKPEIGEIAATMCKLARMQANAEIARTDADNLLFNLEDTTRSLTSKASGYDDLLIRNNQLEAQMRQAVRKGFVPDAVDQPNKYELELAKTNKINAIKELRARTGLGLKEAKDMIEAHCCYVGGVS